MVGGNKTTAALASFGSPLKPGVPSKPEAQVAIASIGTSLMDFLSLIVVMSPSWFPQPGTNLQTSKCPSLFFSDTKLSLLIELSILKGFFAESISVAGPPLAVRREFVSDDNSNYAILVFYLSS